MEGNQALCIFCCKKVNRGSNLNCEEEPVADDEEILERFLLFTDRSFNSLDKKHSAISNTTKLSKSSKACLKCSDIIDYYCSLYHQIECLKLQLNGQLKKVWKIMSYADRVPARVKAFREWCNESGLISPADEKVNEEDPSSGGPIKFRQAFKRRCKLFRNRTSPRVDVTRYGSETEVKNEDDDHGAIKKGNRLPVNLKSTIGKQIKKEITNSEKTYFLGWLSSFATVIFLYHWSPSPGVPPAILEIEESEPPPSKRSTSLPIIIRVINRQSSGFSGNGNTQQQRKSKMKTVKKLNQSVSMYSEESNSHGYSDDGYEDDYDCNEPVSKQRRTKLEVGTGIRSSPLSRSSKGGGGENRAMIRKSQHHDRPSSSSSVSWMNGGDSVSSLHHRPCPPLSSLGTLMNPDLDNSLQDNLSPGSSSADVNEHYEGEGDGVLSASELEEFSRYFKRRRIKFGYSQSDVGVSMSAIYGDVFSQTTISRFEALQLSYKNLLKLQPVMQKWLEEVETGITPTVDKDTVPMFKKRKKRTNIPPHIKSSLENYFRQESKPSGGEVLTIANELQLEKEVVRVWFCNRRAKENNSDSLASPRGMHSGEEQSYTENSRDPLNDFAGDGERQEETGSKIRFIVKKEPIDYHEDEAATMVQESSLVTRRSRPQTSTYSKDAFPNRGYQ